MLNLYIINLVDFVITLLSYLFIARVILSFISLSSHSNPTLNRIAHVIWLITDPILKPIRRVVPPTSVGGGSYVDFSPIVALIILSLIQRFIIQRLLIGLI